MKPKNVNYRRTILGKYEVTYDCPGCGKSLKNDLDDAGKQDQCPHCECDFFVPGTQYKQEIERRQAARHAKKEAEKAEFERQARESRENEKAGLEALESRWNAVKSLNQSESSSERTAIHYISEGLAELVRAFLYSVLGGFYGSIAFYCVMTGSNASSDTQGFFFVLMLVFGTLSIGYMISFYQSTKLAFEAFLKGSKP